MRKLKVVSEHKNTEGDSILWVSGGIASTLACYIYASTHKDENLRFVTESIPGSTHPDHDRFISEISEFFGWKLEVLKSEKFNSHWDVIESRRYINGPSGAPCTSELKRKPMQRFLKENIIKTHVWGFTVEEKKRHSQRESEYSQYHNVSPLIELALTKQWCLEEFSRITEGKIEVPLLYKLGFKNSNCIGCVKGGSGYWNLVRRVFPDVFERMSRIEQSIGASCLKSEEGRIFLKDLNSLSGINEPLVIPECSSFGCEISMSIIEAHLREKTSQVSQNASDK